MAMTKRYGKPFIERVDKNGTEHWVDHNCPKCGGAGYIYGYEFVDNGRCWHCGGSGRRTHTWKVRTPEYSAKLAARRDEKTRKKNLAERESFLLKNGFNAEGVTYVVIGNTFDIKDDLKAAGAKYSAELGWHFTDKSECFPYVELTTEDCFWENEVAGLIWNDFWDIKDLITSRIPKDISTSVYLGEIGKKLTVNVTLKKSYEVYNNFASAYYTTTTYIHSFEDDDGNVIIWKTATFLEGDDKFTLTGTVKEHSEYKGVKQTVLTRCKVK